MRQSMILAVFLAALLSCFSAGATGSGSGSKCFKNIYNPDVVNARSEWTVNGSTVTIRTTLAKTFVDNTYGTNAVGWSGGHTFSQLVGSDNLQIALYDANGVKRLEFKQDYISTKSGTPSGYDCLGVTGGEGQMIVGSSSSIVSATTSLDQNLNTYGYVLTTNSPATNSSYAPNASYPNWIYEVWYEVTVNLSAFGSAGFGYPNISGVHASPSKTGNNSEAVVTTTCPNTLELAVSGNCTQDCTESINLTVNSSNSPFTYLWSTGATTKNISGLCAGTYSVTVTGSNGATFTNSATVTDATCPGGQQCFSSPTIPAIANAHSTWTINGNVLTIRTTFAKTFVDNTYGTNAIGWSNGHTFSNLVGSDHIQLALYDANGLKKLEFKQDYITAASGTPSGYDCLGVTGGEGQMILGSASSILSSTSSLDQNMNTYGYVLTTNSPATNSSYAPNATYPNWIYEVWYEVSVNMSAFGSAGFGYPKISSVHASPSKTGNNTEIVNPTDCPKSLDLKVNGNCTQDCTESITLTVNSSNSPFTYLWSTGATTKDISALCAGTYTVTVTTANGSTMSSSATVTDGACPGGEQCFASPTIPDIANAHSEWTINGNIVTIRTTFARTFVDNTYGTNQIGWSNGHTFNQLVGSDHLQLSLYDANGVKKLEFKQDYITAKSGVPSGYDCLGVTGGEGQMILGSSSSIVGATSSLDQNLNTYGYVLTANSPATNANYAPNATYPNWIYDVWYEVSVNLSAFGSAGFGYPRIASVHASPSKTGNNTEVVTPDDCPVECDGSLTVSAQITPDYQCDTLPPPPNCNCDCTGGLKSLTVMYVGTSGSTLKVYDYTTNFLIATFTNVQFGQILTISAASLPGGKFGKKIYVKDTSSSGHSCGGGKQTKIYTDCSKDLKGNTFGVFKVMGFTDGMNNVCDASAACDQCPCYKYFKQLSLMYNGASGASVAFYEYPNKQKLIASFNNAQHSDILVLENGTKNLPKVIYVYVNGVYKFTLSSECGKIGVGGVYGDFTLVGFIDKKGRECSYTTPCDGDGNINVTVAGGIPPYTYEWTEGQTTQDLSDLCAGDYSITVTDDVGCSVTKEFTVGTAPCASAVIGDFVWHDINANGQQEGGEPGIPGVTVEIYNADDDSLLASMKTDVNGYYLFDSLELGNYYILFKHSTAPSSLLPTLSNVGGDGTDSDADVLTGKTGVYALSPGDTVLTVDAGYRCAQVACSITGETILCPGATSTYTGPAGVTSYEWAIVGDAMIIGANDQRGVTIKTNNNCGSFTLMLVSSNASCSANCEYQVAVEDQIAPTGTISSVPATVECPAKPVFGDITVSDNCDIAPTYIFEDDTTAGSCANEYTVTRTWQITDGCGNSSTASQAVTVIDHTAPVINGVGADQTIQCPEIPQFSSPTVSDACGSATLTFMDDVTFGGCPYEFSITRIWTAIDACGNSSTASQTITAVDTINPVIDGVGMDDTIQCPAKPQFTTPYVIDGCDFDANIPFEDDTIFDSAPETIMFVRTWTAADACGNLSESVSQAIIRKNDHQPATGINPRCHTSCDGSVSVSGDCYSYLWSNGATTATVQNLCAGVYTVTMTDDFGFQVFDTVELVAPAALSLDTVVAHVKCVGAGDGAIDLFVTGGTAPYTYQWSNGYSSQDITGLFIGHYSVTVTDSKGCKDTIAADIRQPEPFTLGAFMTMVTCSGGSDGSIDISVDGATPPYTYLWSIGDTTQDVSGLTAGVYAVTITDAYLCSATLSETVTEYFKVVAAASITDVACHGEATGSINLTVSGGMAPYQFTWSNGATTEDISGLIAGQYSVTVTDSLGCFIQQTETVTEPELCNDNNLCTIDGCVSGQCQYTPVVCNDQNACTIDACVNGECEFTPVICDDNEACTIDACINGACQYAPVICNDNDACTTDACVEGACEYTAIICDDQDACTTDACVNGQCEYTEIICDDSNACTTDACVNDQCEYTAIICDDQDACTTDACVNGQCEYTPVICDDNDACTTDACVNGQCEYTPVICDDSDACTTDACVNGQCEYTPVICDDNDACTTDACVNGSCAYTAIICDDQDACTNDACVGGTCEYTQFMSITGFTLVNATTFDDIRPITNGAVISRDEICQFNIRAEICGDSLVESVRFIVNGNTFRIEEYVPFSLAGDNPQGEYHPWLVGPGTYTITAIPHDLPLGMGAAGDSMTITITVVNGSNMACVCDDNDPCTINQVTEIGQCAFPPVVCDDQNACTIDACASGSCEFTPVICDDNNACTIDACVNGSCEFTAVICDDNDACTTDACVNGSCEYTAIICDDQDACTIDVCVNGSCEFTAVLCDDQNACTIDACIDGSCEFTAVICDDQDACTIDACVNGLCEYTAVICDDNEACTIDACINGACQYAAVICDDNDACTTDACVNGSCEFTAVICDDQDACTIDACVNGSCEYTAVICDDNEACTIDACINGACQYAAVICDDNDACTTDACVSGTCEFTAVICDDNDACTTDACANGSCEYTAVICDDNEACTIDACISGACQYTAIICDDSDGCTIDACISGSCEYTAVTCDDGEACTVDACINGQCEFTAVECADLNSCTEDNCVDGVCIFTPVVCNDFDACTNDACVTGLCEYTPVNCNDNDACTEDFCDAGLCDHSAVNCDDEDACTADACDSGICSHDAVVCTDQDACTMDACVNGQCQFTPVTCDDQNACTTDGCELGECVYLPVPPVVVETEVNICFGDSFYAGGEYHSEAGTYVDTYTGSNGCDSISIIHLTLTHIELTHESTDVSDTCIAGENQLCVLDFAGFPHGTILTGEEYAAYGIHFTGIAYPNTWTNTQNISQLVVFNTFASGTFDHDLQVDIGNIAIFPEYLTDANNNGLVDMPNDTRWGGQQIFTFDFPRTILTVTIVDHDRPGGSIICYDEFNNVINSVPIPTLNDGEVAVVGIHASGVRRLVVDDNDSGGLTDITFDCQNICCDGTAEVFPSNGTAPYSFQWSNGATTAAVEGLCVGTYYVTVTDITGCYEIDTITINAPAEIGFRQVNNSFEEFTAFPSPFTSTFFFEYVAKEAGKTDFRMYNTIGQVVYQSSFNAVEGKNRETVSFDGVDGMYIIELRKNDYSEFIKIHKSR